MEQEPTQPAEQLELFPELAARARQAFYEKLQAKPGPYTQQLLYYFWKRENQ